MCYCPLYGTDSKALHSGTEAGSPYTRTLSIGHHALVVGHVTGRKL